VKFSSVEGQPANNLNHCRWSPNMLKSDTRCGASQEQVKILVVRSSLHTIFWQAPCGKEGRRSPTRQILPHPKLTRPTNEAAKCPARPGHPPGRSKLGGACGASTTIPSCSPPTTLTASSNLEMFHPATPEHKIWHCAFTQPVHYDGKFFRGSPLAYANLMVPRHHSQRSTAQVAGDPTQGPGLWRSADARMLLSSGPRQRTRHTFDDPARRSGPAEDPRQPGHQSRSPTAVPAHRCPAWCRPPQIRLAPCSLQAHAPANVMPTHLFSASQAMESCIAKAMPMSSSHAAACGTCNQGFSPVDCGRAESVMSCTATGLLFPIKEPTNTRGVNGASYPWTAGVGRPLGGDPGRAGHPPFVSCRWFA
jgi:hypothetical protein